MSNLDPDNVSFSATNEEPASELWLDRKFGTRFGTRCVPKMLQIRLIAPSKSLKRYGLQVLSSGC
jgi:hypothetical protein